MTAHWHGRGGLGSTPNFGDDLTPYLCRCLSGREVEFADARKGGCQLVAVGSVLQWVRREFDGHIWGSGYISSVVKRPLMPNAKVDAVRGVQTAQMLGLDPSKIPLGDPGLLSFMLRGDSIPKKYDLGVIPHFIHPKHPLVEALVKRKGVRQINIRGRVPNVIMEAQTCRHIISSSLHGLVLADSLGIPNRWLWLSEGKGLMGGKFKFLDYYSAFGIQMKPLVLDIRDTAASVIKKIGRYRRPGIESTKENLFRSFPFQ